MHQSATFILTCMLFASTLHAVAQDRILVRTNYYPVTGSSIPEINRSLASSRPWRHASTHDGQTVWQIKWSLNCKPTSKGCRLTTFTTETGITITLPTLRAPTNTPPRVFHDWSSYQVSLMKHEQGHAQFPRSAVAEIRQRIKKLQTASDCGTLRGNVKQMVDGVIERYRQLEKEYDTRTNHGATQGARLTRGGQTNRSPNQPGAQQ